MVIKEGGKLVGLNFKRVFCTTSHRRGSDIVAGAVDTGNVLLNVDLAVSEHGTFNTILITAILGIAVSAHLYGIVVVPAEVISAGTEVVSNVVNTPPVFAFAPYTSQEGINALSNIINTQFNEYLNNSYAQLATLFREGASHLRELVDVGNFQQVDFAVISRIDLNLSGYHVNVRALAVILNNVMDYSGRESETWLNNPELRPSLNQLYLIAVRSMGNTNMIIISIYNLSSQIRRYISDPRRPRS